MTAEVPETSNASVKVPKDDDAELSSVALIKGQIDKALTGANGEPNESSERPEKIDLKIDWSSLDQEAVLRALEKYDEVDEPKPGSKIGEILIYQGDVIAANDERLKFEVIKLPKKYKEAKDQLQINILRPSIDEEDICHYVAEFDFARNEHRTEEEWDMKHRRTGEAYREQGIAGKVLSLAEKFLQRRSVQKNMQEKMSAQVWQRGLIDWLNKKDYKPSTDEDIKKLERIRRGDKDLEIYTAPKMEGESSERSDAIFDKKEFMKRFAGIVTGPEDAKVWDYHNYDEDFFYIKSAFSVKLEKDFPPNSPTSPSKSQYLRNSFYNYRDLPIPPFLVVKSRWGQKQ